MVSVSRACALLKRQNITLTFVWATRLDNSDKTKDLRRYTNLFIIIIIIIPFRDVTLEAQETF